MTIITREVGQSAVSVCYVTLSAEHERGHTVKRAKPKAETDLAALLCV